jgi:RHS repeat-associated protein
MPIDIATGEVQLARDDFVLPGRVPIKWTRRYRSTLLGATNSPLGPGWTTSWFPTLNRAKQAWDFVTPTGVKNTFPDPEDLVGRGQIIRLLGAFLELVRENGRYIVTEWDVESGEIQRFVFSAEESNDAPPLVSVENVSGDGVEVSWDAPGRLKSLRQQIENRTVLFNYSAGGRIASVSLSRTDGSRADLVRYEYDSVGRLSAVFDRRDLANRYEYDENSRVRREILKDGAVYTYRYDNKDRCIHFTGLNHYNEKRLRFIDAANRTMVTDSYGKTTIFECTASGQIAAEFSPAGHERRTVFDEYNRTIAKIDGTGAATRYTYDQSGNRDSVINPLGQAYRFAFNAHHQRISVTNPLGQTWFREYDANHRLVVTKDPLGARWITKYDEIGNPVRIIDPLGSQRSFTYVDGLLRERTDWMAHVTRFSWDEFGRVTERIGPQGERTAINYDDAGNPIELDLPDGSHLRATYDAGENPSSFTNAKGYTTRLRFGPCHRLLECVDPIGRATRYLWSTEPEQLEAFINEKGETFRFFRNDQGKIVRECSFDSRERFFEFDAAGRRVAVVNGNGQRIVFKRDPAGRLVEQTLPDGTTTTFEYDAVGRILKAENPDAHVAFEYDVTGRLVLEVQGKEWIRTNYNAAGDVIRLQTSLGHEIRYDLDPNGRPRKLSTGQQRFLTIERDASGRVTGQLIPGGLALEQRFNSMGRMLKQRTGRLEALEPGSAHEFRVRTDREVVKRDYRYDPDGLLLSVADARWGEIDYTYDSAERIHEAVRDDTLNEQFEYDPADNLVQTRWQSSELSWSYGAGNRLLQQGDTRYEYDPEGQLVRKTEAASSKAPQVWHYTWNAQGQLRSLQRPDGVQFEYRYDAFGRRVSKIGPATTHRFLWNGDVVIHEMWDDREPVAWITQFGSFAPLAKIQQGEFFTIINDHLGTPRELFDSSGRLVWQACFSTWGRLDQEHTSLSEVDCPIRFQGQWFDQESGLHYNRFRYYDPNCGRFIQQDPLKLLGAPNFYSYPNPINSLDPWGLECSNESGEKGRAKAKEDLRKAGFTIIDEEVTMLVGNPPQRIRADFVAENPNGRLYVFEVKNGTGGLTSNQEASGVFNIDNPANQNGAIRTSGGSDPPGRRDTFEVDTGRPTAVGDRGDTGSATFAVLKYDGSPGSRVQ